MKTSIFIGGVAAAGLIAFFGLAVKKEGKQLFAKRKMDCGCYANGTWYTPGSNFCLQGFWVKCGTGKGLGHGSGECSWNYHIQNGNYVLCE